MPSPIVGPSYNLTSRPASVQRTINMYPVPLEPGNERTDWVLKDVPGLRQFSLSDPTLGWSDATYLVPPSNIYFGDSTINNNGLEKILLRVQNPLSTILWYESLDTLPIGGKWYIEFRVQAYGSSPFAYFGIVRGGFGWAGPSNSFYYQQDGNFNREGAIIGSSAVINSGDVVMMAYDTVSRNLWFGKNGTWSGDPAAGTGSAGVFTSAGAPIRVSAANFWPATDLRLRLSARAMSYPIPAGFSALGI